MHAFCLVALVDASPIGQRTERLYRTIVFKNVAGSVLCELGPTVSYLTVAL